VGRPFFVRERRSRHDRVLRRRSGAADATCVGRVLAEFLLQVALTAWVYQDARRRDWEGDRFADTPFKWALGAFFLWIVAVPVYLYKRGDRPFKSDRQPHA